MPALSARTARDSSLTIYANNFSAISSETNSAILVTPKPTLYADNKLGK